jgi:hypothetical protein
MVPFVMTPAASIFYPDYDGIRVLQNIGLQATKLLGVTTQKVVV